LFSQCPCLFRLSLPGRVFLQFLDKCLLHQSLFDVFRHHQLRTLSLAQAALRRPETQSVPLGSSAPELLSRPDFFLCSGRRFLEPSGKTLPAPETPFRKHFARRYIAFANFLNAILNAVAPACHRRWHPAGKQAPLIGYGSSFAYSLPSETQARSCALF